MLIFEKYLEQGDINDKLMIFCKAFHQYFPRIERGRGVDIVVRYGYELKRHILRCTKRPEACEKPVLFIAWRRLASEKKFQVGDKLELYLEENGYKIEVYRERERKLVNSERETWTEILN